MKSINLLLANEIQDMPALKLFFLQLRVLARKIASPFGHPAAQVSTHVRLAISCESFWPELKMKVLDLGRLTVDTQTTLLITR